jgi:hypothetical protein
MWLLVAMVAASIMVSGHPDRAACEHQMAELQAQNVPAKCIAEPALNGTFTLIPCNGFCGPK